MRANYKMQRLFVEGTLARGATLPLTKNQTNYLLNVLRMDDGNTLLVFNGRDGEWRATVDKTGKKTAQLLCTDIERAQTAASGLVFCFAPLKAGRLDYLVQKAVEMGAGTLIPVLTDYTQNHRLSAAKIEAWAIEAAEQCGVLSIPHCSDPVKLDRLLADWDEARTLIFCDEDSETNNPVAHLTPLKGRSLGVLVGPEGGFSKAERETLKSLDHVAPIPLGPRILRADTAAVAALAVVQALAGDW
ncbi:MAG: 16S rRNA (uracil(1498)-N(3))-methyltransferase [Pseudomonadota bacterium]